MDTRADSDIEQLQRRLQRETSARQQAEAVAEGGLREIHRRQQQMDLLEIIAVASNEATRASEAIGFALREICRYTQWTIGHALAVTDASANASSRLVSMRLWHMDSVERCLPFQECSEGLCFLLKEGLPGRVWESRRPCWIMDISAESDFPRASSALRSGLRAGFAFPVLIGSEVAAVLEFYSEQMLPPDDDLLRVMLQIGTQLGRVIERQRAKDNLQHEALHDALTTLANRALFLDRLQLALGRSQRNANCHFAVLLLDLDRFKTINDSLGHVAGDQLLVAIAERMSDCLRDDAIYTQIAEPGARAKDPGGGRLIARLGGDEFSILLDDIGGPSDALRVAERIQDALTEPFQIAGHAIYSTASIGITESSTGYQDVQDILRDAAAAMYRAKSAGRARCELFDRTMHGSALAKLQLEADLHRAVQQDQFSLRYQPVVALQDGSIRGFEALIRWEHPVRGTVSPADFIELAEEVGLINAIGDWVLAEACRQAADWHRRYACDPPLTISVNVSAYQLNQADLIERIEQILRDNRLPAACLKLELTESAVASDSERARSVFLRLRALGVQLSIDDFGTGYSSLGQLRRLPVDTLKVDRSFVTQMDTDDEKRQIAHVIVSLAKLLGMTVVAEGAETSGEIDALKSIECQYAQGYFYHPPLAIADAEAVLAAQQARAG